MSRHGHVPRPGLPHVTGIWNHSVSLLIIGFRTAASRSSAICDLYSTCASALRTRVVSTRDVSSWICGFNFCRHLLGLVQLLPASFHSVLMYLSLLLIVAVANELATLKCVSLAVSVSQERKQHGTIFVRDIVRANSTLLVSELALFCRKLFPSTPKTAIVRVRTLMLVTSFELSASTADAVLEFSVPVLASASFASAPCHDVLQHSLAFWTFQSDSVFSSSSCFPAKINHC